MKFRGLVDNAPTLTVAPLAGAWIEITEEHTIFHHGPESLPFAGAWIEILPVQKSITPCRVAPLAGAWIEIDRIFVDILYATSLPSRERGLKSATPAITAITFCVAPLAGAWIEIRVNL